MALTRLDHVTVNCADLERSRAFYSAALGLAEGERPAFAIPGAWFYLDGRPIVHLIGDAGAAARGAGGAIDHVAFEAQDFDETLERLSGLDLAPKPSAVPGAAVMQIFVIDPDGVKIELNFRR